MCPFQYLLSFQWTISARVEASFGPIVTWQGLKFACSFSMRCVLFNKVWNANDKIIECFICCFLKIIDQIQFRWENWNPSSQILANKNNRIFVCQVIIEQSYLLNDVKSNNFFFRKIENKQKRNKSHLFIFVIKTKWILFHWHLLCACLSSNWISFWLSVSWILRNSPSIKLNFEWMRFDGRMQGILESQQLWAQKRCFSFLLLAKHTFLCDVHRGETMLDTQANSFYLLWLTSFANKNWFPHHFKVRTRSFFI